MPKVPLSGLCDQPQPNPELLKKDPIAEMFGPGSGLKIYGDPEDDIPDEVRAALEEAGLSKKSFHCMLKEVRMGSEGGALNGTNTEFVTSFHRGVPSPGFIAKEYGPGSYLLMFSWEGRDDDNKPRTKHQEVPVIISEKALGEFKRNRLASKIKDATEIGSQVRDALVEKSIEGSMLSALTGKDGDSKDPKTTAKEYIAETIENARMLGLSPLSAQPVATARTFEWDKILPPLLAAIPALMQMQQAAERARSDDFNKMLMLMMSTSQNSNNQLIEIMKLQSKPADGATAFKETRDMIFNMLEVKEALNGDRRETLGDKIFRLVESVAPSILSIAATTAQAQTAQNNPMVKMAKGYIANNPDFQELKNNPAEQKSVIDRLDKFYGQNQVDIILQVAGWERPAECPRKPELAEPPRTDPEEPIVTGDNEDVIET
jgi:hypothetical protein